LTACPAGRRLPVSPLSGAATPAWPRPAGWPTRSTARRPR
jgi:hypothetical protein